MKEIKIKYYNLWLNSINYDNAKCIIEEFLSQCGVHSILFVNAHYFNLAQKDEEYREVLNNSDLLLNDGIGIKLGGMLQGFLFKQNMNGTDFIPFVLNYYCSKSKYGVFLLGGKPGVAEGVYEQRRDLNIKGFQHGYFLDEENQKIIDKINESKSEFLIIGMGSPIQEKWLEKHREHLNNVKICICGGAILDFMSNSVPRAPQIIRNLGMEWVFRLCLEPKRLGNRYLIGNIKFIYSVFKLRLIKG